MGDECVLYSGAAIYHDCRVGNRCTLHSGSVVGADGFGFAPTADGYDKIPQIGIAILEDDVEVGANTCNRPRHNGGHGGAPGRESWTTSCR